jgi:2-succinyl-5-enolpyruvyl-6-hydroxy-3-cyclohexene-1-carboxylate synthase
MRGVIVAGPAQPADPAAYCVAVARVAAATGWPVLTDGLNPLRSQPPENCAVVANYNAVLRSPRLAERLMPEGVLSLGDWPASKQLRSSMQGFAGETWVVAPDARNHDALHGRTHHWRGTVEALAAGLASGPGGPAPHAAEWMLADRAAGEAIDRRLSALDFLFEGKVSWLLSRHLPSGTPLFVANSMPVRHVDFFWKPAARNCPVFFNRGASGIDGTLSTAMGVAHGGRPAVLLTGDLALLHDTNGFLLAPKLRGSLTIVLINNHGGGIFEMLPVAQFEPPFEEFFATPQEVDFGRLCSAYGAGHVIVRDWAHLQELVSALPETGVRVIEIRTDRRRDAAFCREILGAASQAAEGAFG